MKITAEKPLFYTGLAVALIIGALFRFYDLSSVPPGIWFDEAAYSDKAMYFLNYSRPLIYYIRGEMQIGMFPALLAMGFAVLGDTIVAPRMVMAIFGFATLIGCALLTLELLKDSKYKRPVALIATFLLATSYWHLNFSRLIFSASLVPAFEVFALLLTLRAFRGGDIKTVIAAAVVTALGFYTYWQYYPFIAIPAGIALLYLISDFGKYKKTFLQYSLVGIAAVLPLAFGLYENATIPQLGVMNRLKPLVISPSFAEFCQNSYLHVKMLFVEGRGDGNWRHNLAGQAQLSPLAGFGAIAGVAYFIFLLICRRKPENDPVKVPAVLLLWCFLAMLPASLSNEGLPHASRAVGMVVPLQILAALGIFTALRIAYELLRKVMPPKAAMYVLGVLMLLPAAFQTVDTANQYFNIFANSPHAKNAFVSSDPKYLKYNFSQEVIRKFGR